MPKSQRMSAASREQQLRSRSSGLVQPQPLDFEIVRGGVPLPSIRNYFMLPNGVGYVGLTGGFQETTADELDAAVADLQKQGMKSLILDLREQSRRHCCRKRSTLSGVSCRPGRRSFR